MFIVAAGNSSPVLQCSPVLQLQIPVRIFMNAISDLRSLLQHSRMGSKHAAQETPAVQPDVGGVKASRFQTDHTLGFQDHAKTSLL